MPSLRKPSNFLRQILAFLSFIWGVSFANAQMEGMHHGMAHDSSMSMQMESGTMKMPSMIMLTLPMERDGSGTSWLPDNSQMHALHTMLGDWNAMLHGQLTLRYTSQDAFKSGSRGASRWDGPNWIMGMLSRPLGTSRTVIGTGSMNLALGMQGTFYGVATDLQPLYGNAPVSVEVFVTLTPAGMHMNGSMHKGMDHTMPVGP